jgi:diadenosine tetraphosphate (Ap4A) HIT family hydrolase
VSTENCAFCEIVAGRSPDTLIHREGDVVAFMDAYPATTGHLLVVPMNHAVGLTDLDEEVGARVWRLAHRMGRAVLRSSLGAEGVNVHLCDGEVAGQSVLHVHLHVIPRYKGDSLVVRGAKGRAQPDRVELEETAAILRSALEGSTDS